jgi:hypothetical protein
VLLSTVNEAAMVPFVSQQLNNLDLALAMARRGNLPGAEGLVAQQFERMFAAGQYKEAAEVAAESPQGVLRTKEVGGAVSEGHAARGGGRAAVGAAEEMMPGQRARPGRGAGGPRQRRRAARCGQGGRGPP